MSESSAIVRLMGVSQERPLGDQMHLNLKLATRTERSSSAMLQRQAHERAQGANAFDSRSVAVTHGSFAGFELRSKILGARRFDMREAPPLKRGISVLLHRWEDAILLFQADESCVLSHRVSLDRQEISILQLASHFSQLLIHAHAQVIACTVLMPDPKQQNSLPKK